jgi:hypothetical protein
MTRLTEDNSKSMDTNNHTSIDIHNALVSKLTSEVYVAIGSLYESNGRVPG